MDRNDELQKKARKDEIAIKGTVTPDVTGEAVITHDPNITADECEHRSLRICRHPELHR